MVGKKVLGLSNKFKCQTSSRTFTDGWTHVHGVFLHGCSDTCIQYNESKNLKNKDGNKSLETGYHHFLGCLLAQAVWSQITS